MHRRADSRDHVFALRVQQKIAEESLLAGRRVAREADARAGIVARVAENHLHHVHRRAQQARDFLDAPVGDRLLAHPGLEHRADRAPELLLRILRKVLAGFLLEVSLVFADQLPPALGA